MRTFGLFFWYRSWVKKNKTIFWVEITQKLIGPFLTQELGKKKKKKPNFFFFFSPRQLFYVLYTQSEQNIKQLL